jgi:hypothetical protein
MTTNSKARFPLGHIVSTPGALEALTAENLNGVILLQRHVSGDWGDITFR